MFKGRFLRGAAAVCGALFFTATGLRVLASCASYGLPFTDLGSTAFCAQIAEAYFSGLTNGTSATTFSPTATVNRTQMAAFVTRTLDQSLARGGRRAALRQWWNSTPHYDQGLGLTTVGNTPQRIQSDGVDVWTPNNADASVSRVRASDGKVLDTWTGATHAIDVLIAMNKIFVAGNTSPNGSLYEIDPSQPGTTVTTLISTLGNDVALAFDGNFIWTANFDGSVSKITPGAWTFTTASNGFSQPGGILFDGSNIWVTDQGDNKLKKLNSDGSIALSVNVGTTPGDPLYDGHNIWVSNFGDNSLTVVRASDGVVLKTFSSGNGNQNGLNEPTGEAFDGQRILVPNFGASTVSLFKAADLSAIGVFPIGMANPNSACSDGTNFWVSFRLSNKIGKY